MAKEIICLDTSILIEYFRSKNKSQTQFYRLTQEGRTFSVTSITVFEILRGSSVGQSGFWEEVFSRMEVLDFTSETASIAAQTINQLKNKGKSLAIPDLFIASCVIEHKHILATLNFKHFKLVPDLNILE